MWVLQILVPLQLYWTEEDADETPHTITRTFQMLHMCNENHTENRQLRHTRLRLQQGHYATRIQNSRIVQKQHRAAQDLGKHA